jgi:hypothetical protein
LGTEERMRVPSPAAMINTSRSLTPSNYRQGQVPAGCEYLRWGRIFPPVTTLDVSGE